MEEIFDQMNNEVDKNTVDKQCAEIEKKNLLIENENLIVNCLSTQLLYDVEKSRCLDLEADMSKVHDESKLISKLEREYLNLQLKYQHLQENLEHQIKEKDNVIRHLKDLVASMNDKSREPYNALTEIESPKSQVRSKEHVFTSDYVKPKVLAPGIYWFTIETTGKKSHLRKLVVWFSMETTGKKFALGDYAVNYRFKALVYGTQAVQKNDVESFKAHEICGKVHWVSQIRDDHLGLSWGYGDMFWKGYRIYNKRTRRLMETIHVTFNEMHQSMAPVHFSLTTIAQDAPSTSDSSSTSDIHLPVQHQEIAEEPIQEDTPIIHDVLHPSHNLVTRDPGSAQSSSGNVNAAEPNQVNYPPDHIRRWTKDHPLDNIVGNPSPTLYQLRKH
ncbi:hypothetical protein Tco_0237899 [Tanacetum coccineum]